MRDLADPLLRYLDQVAPYVPARELMGGSDDVEALLGYLAEPQPWQSDAVLHRCRAALTETILWLADYIWSCQCAAMDNPAPDDLLELIRHWHRDQSTVITFNYDTLVEAAFASLREELCFPRSAAGHLCLSTLNLPMLSARQGNAVLGGEDPATFEFLKLHGSLNWMYSGDRGGYGDALYDTREIGTWGTRLRRSFESVRLEAPGLEVALLPPTPTKNGMMTNGMLRHLWVRAADAIASADRVVVIGYSLPPSDRIVRSMLSVMGRPLSGNEPPKKLVPVDRSTAVRGTLAELLPSAEIEDAWCGFDDAVSSFVRNGLTAIQ